MNIVEYDEFREKMNQVKEKCNFLADVSTDEGYEKSKRVALDVGKLLTGLEKKRVEKKAFFLDGGKEVDKQAATLKEELEGYQLPHKEAYKELDKLKKEREANRKVRLEERVSLIRDLPELMADSSSDEVKTAMNKMQEEECLDFYEFTEHALKARNATRQTLGEMFVLKLKKESDAKELAKLREEQAKREVKEREDAIRKQASAKAEADKLAAEKAKDAAERYAKDAKKDAEMAEEKAKADAVQAAKNAEAATIAAKSKAKKEAAAAAKKAKNDEIERQERERKAEAAAIEKREANKKHVGKIRGEAKTDLIKIGLSEADAKKVVLAISNGNIKNVTIKY